MNNQLLKIVVRSKLQITLEKEVKIVIVNQIVPFTPIWLLNRRLLLW